jgi:predicted signal transduction protein with EAL and GGDEF domain
MARHGRVPVYLALLALAGPGLMSLYRRYDVRCLAKAVQLQGALRRNEIVLHYQPKVSIETGEVSAVEVLARWEHPRRGLLPPAEFIAAAERTWLAKRFDLYVVRAANRAGTGLGARRHIGVTSCRSSQLDDCTNSQARLLVVLQIGGVWFSSHAGRRGLASHGRTLRVRGVGTGPAPGGALPQGG